MFSSCSDDYALVLELQHYKRELNYFSSGGILAAFGKQAETSWPYGRAFLYASEVLRGPCGEVPTARSNGVDVHICDVIDNVLHLTFVKEPLR